MVGRLPYYYTDVPPVTTNMKNISVPATSVVSLARDNFKNQTEEEYMWLEHAMRVIEDNTGTYENISWSAFYASRQQQLARTIKAEIATPGTADSILRAAHVTRTRRANQITATTLHIRQRRAYTRHCMTDFDNAEDLPEFEDWCQRRAKYIPHFQYWASVLELDMLVLVYVRSLRHASFAMYLAAPMELVPWFHALDHTHYARWIPVHLKDMAALPMKHPGVARGFRPGNFTVRRKKKVFYSIKINQAHEQNNALIK